MVYLLPIFLLSMNGCSSPSAKISPESWTSQDSIVGLEEDGSSRTDGEFAMLRSSQSENGYYGKEAEAEINQILRFLEGR